MCLEICTQIRLPSIGSWKLNQTKIASVFQVGKNLVWVDVSATVQNMLLAAHTSSWIASIFEINTIFAPFPIIRIIVIRNACPIAGWLARPPYQVCGGGGVCVCWGGWRAARVTLRIPSQHKPSPCVYSQPAYMGHKNIDGIEKSKIVAAWQAHQNREKSEMQKRALQNSRGQNWKTMPIRWIRGKHRIVHLPYLRLPNNCQKMNICNVSRNLGTCRVWRDGVMLLPSKMLQGLTKNQRAASNPSKFRRICDDIHIEWCSLRFNRPNGGQQRGDQHPKKRIPMRRRLAN